MCIILVWSTGILLASPPQPLSTTTTTMGLFWLISSIICPTSSVKMDTFQIKHQHNFRCNRTSHQTDQTQNFQVTKKKQFCFHKHAYSVLRKEASSLPDIHFLFYDFTYHNFLLLLQLLLQTFTTQQHQQWQHFSDWQAANSRQLE